MASSVLPAALPKAGKIESAEIASAMPVGSPVANAAAKTAGQMRIPRKSTAAKASPAGGQIGIGVE